MLYAPPAESGAEPQKLTHFLKSERLFLAFYDDSKIAVSMTNEARITSFSYLQLFGMGSFYTDGTEHYNTHSRINKSNCLYIFCLF